LADFLVLGAGIAGAAMGNVEVAAAWRGLGGSNSMV
jgi:hypothetical protein